MNEVYPFAYLVVHELFIQGVQKVPGQSNNSRNTHSIEKLKNGCIKFLKNLSKDSKILDMKFRCFSIGCDHFRCYHPEL